jgi:hypothetical protein
MNCGCRAEHKGQNNYQAGYSLNEALIHLCIPPEILFCCTGCEMISAMIPVGQPDIIRAMNMPSGDML